ncbi:MAG: YolD-like family protein [Prevotella sp.]|nr:YolD-like family protein [Prevotella sp.]
MKEDYSDIINLPHHVSKNHPQMSMMARAAQFAPFAALTGYDAVIHETARHTDKQVELGEYDNERLNRKFAELMDIVHEHPEVTVAYFKPDKCKAGGAYLTVSHRLKKIDTYEQFLILDDDSRIPIADIVDIQF